MGPDPLKHKPRREQPQLPGLVQVNVDRHVMALRDVEHDVEVLHRILIKAARVNAAHHIGALAQRGLDQGFGVHRMSRLIWRRALCAVN